MPARSSVALDGVLAEVGHFGAYQLRVFCAILAPILLCSVYNAQYIFTAADADYRCLVPECESRGAQWAAGPWAQWALVAGSRCERRAPIAPGASCQRDSFTRNTQRCDAWLYRTHDSIVAEFDLACEEWKRTLVGTLHSTGVFSALLYVGVVSDRVGRRVTFILTASLSGAVGLARSLVHSYSLFLALEFLDAAVGAGVYTTAFVLALEIVGMEKRVLCGGVLSCAYAAGQLALALLAWLVPYWRSLTQIVYAPALLFLLYFFFLKESFRWLYANNRTAEAIEILRGVAAANNKVLTDAMVKRLTSVDLSKAPVVGAGGGGGGGGERGGGQRSVLCAVLRSRVLMSRGAVCSYCWVTCTFVYYGLSVNSVSLAGNMYCNYALISLVEIPGYLLSVLMLDRFGRKKSMMFLFLACSVALVALPFIPPGVAQVSLALAGKLCVSAVFNGIYVFTAELFPTPVRHRALAACSLVARIGQILAMLTPLLMSVRASLPFLVFGVLSGAAAVLLLLTPETLHAPLPDTVEQAERLDAPSPAAPPAPPPAPPPAAQPSRASGPLAESKPRDT